MFPSRWTPIFLCFLGAGCEGQLTPGNTGANPEAERASEPPSSVSDGDDSEPPDPSGPPAPADEPDPSTSLPAAFTLRTDAADLLPFRVRLDRASHLFELPVRDAAFNTAREQRLALGDHHFASGQLPVHTWNASGMMGWVRATRPPCQLDSVRDLASSPASLTPFLERAYGRRVSEAEVESYLEGVQSVPEAERSELVCLVVVSSAEFVLR